MWYLLPQTAQHNVGTFLICCRHSIVIFIVVAKRNFYTTRQKITVGQGSAKPFTLVCL